MPLLPPSLPKLPDTPKTSFGFSQKNIPEELNSSQKWSFLDENELPDRTITRKKIKASDDLPATDSGWWLIRNEIIRQPWAKIVHRPTIETPRTYSIHPPAGWFSNWSKTQFRYETSVVYPQPTFWWRLAEQFQRIDWLHKIKEAGILCWVPFEDRENHKKQVFSLLGRPQKESKPSGIPSIQVPEMEPEQTD